MLHQYGGGGGGHHQQNITSPGAMAASTFSLFFPLPKGQQRPPQAEESAYSYDDRSTVTTSVPSSPASSSSTGSVDCTLSLGTPSSRRRAGPAEPRLHGAAPQPCPSSVSAATLSWDAAAESYYYQQGNKPAAAARGAVGAHQLLDRRCANCGTSSTPLWRNGPRGPKSLCNACGIRFKKEERRAAESGGAGAGVGVGCSYAAQRAPVSVPGAPRAVSYGAEEALPCGGAGADAPFLPWRLNVVPPAAAAVWPERASLYQYN